MKNKPSDLVRIKNLIDLDRFRSSDIFLELLKKDLNKLLKEYFDFSGDINIVVSKNKNGFSVDVNLFVDRIKSFVSVPN